MADYVRVKLGWNNFDKPDEYPCRKHTDLGCSKCDADFLFWIEEKCLDGNFIIDLNKALQEGQYTDNFLKNRFGKNILELHSEYRKELLE